MNEKLEQGYIKLYRSLLQSDIWIKKSLSLKVVAITCLLKTNHKDNYWNRVLIKRGSFATSISQLARDCFIRRSTLRDCLSALISANFIAIESASRYKIITVSNYESYQAQSYPQAPDNPPQSAPDNPPQTGQTGPTNWSNGTHKQLKEKNNKEIFNFIDVNKSVKMCANCVNYDLDKRACYRDKNWPLSVNWQTIACEYFMSRHSKNEDKIL